MEQKGYQRIELIPLLVLIRDHNGDSTVYLYDGNLIDYYRTLAFEELVHIEVGLRVNGISQKLGDKDYHE